MVLVNGLLEARSHHMRVDFCGSDVGVAEHGLYAAQIGATLNQVSRKGVPQHMRAEMPENTRPFTVTSQQLPEALACHGAAARGYKQIRAWTTLEQQRALIVHIFCDRLERSASDRHNPLFVTF